MADKAYRITKANGKITKEEIPPIKKQVFFTRVPEELYLEIQRMAKEEERTFQAVATRIIRKGLEQDKVS